MTTMKKNNGFFIGIWAIFLREAFPVLIKQFSLIMGSKGMLTIVIH